MGHLTQEGHLIKEDQEVKLQSNLIIQKYKESGNVHIFLSTVVGYISTPDAETQGVSPWLWTGDRKIFTGYQFFTNPDGSLRGAFQYSNSHRTSIILDIYNKEYEYIYPQEAFTIRFGSIVTKGNEMEEDQKYCDDCQKIFDSEESNCPQCGSWLMDLDEIIVTPQPDPQPERCAECNFLIENCVCDNNNVDECPHCGLPHCSGECRNIGGDGTSSGGSITPGGNPEGDDEVSSVKFVTFKGLYIDSLLLDNGMTRTRELLQQLESDCMASALIYAISGTKVIGSNTLGNDVARFDPNTGTIKINLTVWQEDINILEEMIHALQKKNGNYIGVKGQPNNLFNVEVEAKIALFRYLKKCGKANFMPMGTEDDWTLLVNKYLETGSIEDYDAIAAYFRTESQNSGLEYGDTDKYQEMEGYKNINNIGTLFNCDDYNN